MPTIRSSVQSPSSLSAGSLSTLASGAFTSSTHMNHTTNNPLDVLVRVSVATTNAVGSNKLLIVYAQGSLDNTNFTSGPTSGTTTTDEPDLQFVGVVPMNSSSTTHTRFFSLAAAFGGVLPRFSRLVFKNEAGAALTSATVETSEVWGYTI